jgi:hypothetical protein
MGPIWYGPVSDVLGSGGEISDETPGFEHEFDLCVNTRS